MQCEKCKKPMIPLFLSFVCENCGKEPATIQETLIKAFFENVKIDILIKEEIDFLGTGLPNRLMKGCLLIDLYRRNENITIDVHTGNGDSWFILVDWIASIERC